MDAETRQLLRGTIRQVLEKASALDLQDHLSELGWAEVVADDPQTALEVLFDAQGRSLAATPALDDVVLTALAPVVGEASGATAVIYPSPPQGSRPSSTALPAATPDVHVEGLALAGLERATRLVVPVITTDSIGLALLERGAWVDSVPIQGIDATAGFSWVEGQSSVPASQLYVGDEVTEAWTTAVAAARRAQGYELVAMADEMLTLAVSHVVDRFQFGRAIGSYQAVKHRLAEVLVSITAARSALNESWADGDPGLATVARGLAGRAHAESAKQGQQVLGGIGFTWEHPFHHFVRRGYALDAVLGSWTALRAEVGQEILSSGHVPRVPVL